MMSAETCFDPRSRPAVPSRKIGGRRIPLLGNRVRPAWNRRPLADERHIRPAYREKHRGRSGNPRRQEPSARRDARRRKRRHPGRDRPGSRRPQTNAARRRPFLAAFGRTTPRSTEDPSAQQPPDRPAHHRPENQHRTGQDELAGSPRGRSGRRDRLVRTAAAAPGARVARAARSAMGRGDRRSDRPQASGRPRSVGPDAERSHPRPRRRPLAARDRRLEQGLHSFNAPIRRTGPTTAW